MDDIHKKIRENRSNIKQNSLNAYISNIKKVFREVFDDEVNIKNLNQFVKVKKYLESLTPATRKNVMNSLIVLLKAYDVNKTTLNKYQNYFESLIDDYENNYNKQEKSQKEEKNWITTDQIKKKIKELDDKISKMDMESLDKNELDLIQQHLILNLYTEIPPMRNDYAQMKVSDKDLKNDNYINLKTKEIVLNKYKTAKTYGEKKIPIPPKILTLIKRWHKLNNSQYLLINIRDKNAMTNNGLTKYLNKIFNPKKVSTTILRKLYLSEKYPVIHNRNDMKKDAYIMGHSIKTQQGIYRKK